MLSSEKSAAIVRHGLRLPRVVGEETHVARDTGVEPELDSPVSHSLEVQVGELRGKSPPQLIEDVENHRRKRPSRRRILTGIGSRLGEEDVVAGLVQVPGGAQRVPIPERSRCIRPRRRSCSLRSAPRFPPPRRGNVYCIPASAGLMSPRSIACTMIDVEEAVDEGRRPEGLVVRRCETRAPGVGLIMNVVRGEKTTLSITLKASARAPTSQRKCSERKISS